MNTSTQAMSNVNKVQTPAAASKPQQGKQDTELNFTELFSSALGQSAPKAQLNSIESQLRESLYQQNKPEKLKNNGESNANAEAAQAAQAAVWAQRNWMQTAAVSTPASNAVAGNTEPVRQTAAPENRAENNTAESNTPVQSENAGKTVESNKSNVSSAEKNADQTAEQNPEQATKFELPPNATNSANKNVVPGNTAIAPSATAELPLNGTNNGEMTISANQAGGEQNTANVQVAADKTVNDNKTTAQLKAEAALASSTIQGRAEASSGNGAGNLGNQVGAQPNTPLNPQLNTQQLPQTAAQMAQQVQAFGEALGEGAGQEGLKVGQKILATGNLQATGIAVGTNGLTGTAGTAQQALIKTPVNQPGFAKELGQTVQWAIGKNLSTVDIRVNPESFGPMNMRLVQKGQQVQLVIRTQDEASANLLTQALGGLKEVLAQNGLQLNQVQIQHGNTPTPQGQANNGQAQFDQNRNQSQGQGGGQHGTGSNNAQAETIAATASATARKPEGTLDMFA